MVGQNIPAEDETTQRSVAEIKVEGESQIALHLTIISGVRENARTQRDTIPSFDTCLKEFQKVILLLEQHRLLEYHPRQEQPQSSKDPYSLDLEKHPLWSLAISMLFENLYPSSIDILEQPISSICLPFDLAYQTLVASKNTTDNPGKLLETFQDLSILRKFLGEEPITVSEYLLAVQFNLGRLLAQNQKDIQELASNERIQRTPIPPGLVPEIVVYYIARNISIDKAIDYLEQLWNKGWIHDVYTYSQLWFALSYWRMQHPQKKYYDKGRSEYVDDILRFVYTVNVIEDELVSIARHIKEQARSRLDKYRVKCNDYDTWFRSVHYLLLHFEAVKIPKYISGFSDISKDAKNELNSIWRYSMEITADIAAFIHNPSTLSLMRMETALAQSSNEQELNKRLRFYNKGRVDFYQTLHKKLTGKLHEALRTEISSSTINEYLIEILIDNMGLTLYECYQRTSGLGWVEWTRRDTPDQSELGLGDQYLQENSTFRSYLIAQILHGQRLTYTINPYISSKLNYSVGLDENMRLRFTQEQGHIVSIGIELANNSVQADESIDVEQVAQHEMMNVNKWIELMRDLVVALTQNYLVSKSNVHKLQQIFVDSHFSPNVLFLIIQAGSPAEFQLIPRVMLTNVVNDVIKNPEIALRTGSGSAALYALSRQGELPPLCGKPFEDIPIRWAIARTRTDNGYIMVSLERSNDEK